VDSEIVPGAVVLVLGLIAFVLLVAAEAGVIAGVRERALREPAESRVDALRRFYQERQLTLSSLAFARNLALVGSTAIVVFIVLREWDDSWPALAATAVAVAAAFMLLQALPRTLVRRDPERSQRALKPFVGFVRAAFRWPVMMLDAPMGAVVRTWQRRQPAAGIGAEELLLLTEMEEAGAALQDEERQMIRGVMELEFTTVREVMVPRTDIIALDAAEGFDRLAQVMVDNGYSRLPVFENNIDNIVGIAYGKQVLKHLAKGTRPAGLQEIIRPAHFVPESKKVHEMLAEMREKHLSIAIVVDEYGGTAGLVTIEDLLEEIVGEIRDEFDIQEQEVQLLTATDAIVDGRVSIDDLSEIFGVEIQKNDFDSIGGFIVNELGRMPSVGDQVRVDGISLRVLSVSGRRIKKVRVTRVEEAPGNGNAPPGK
jgi:CBS domain containing-hemolysin-like protein